MCKEEEVRAALVAARFRAMSGRKRRKVLVDWMTRRQHLGHLAWEFSWLERYLAYMVFEDRLGICIKHWCCGDCISRGHKAITQMTDRQRDILIKFSTSRDILSL